MRQIIYPLKAGPMGQNIYPLKAGAVRQTAHALKAGAVRQPGHIGNRQMAIVLDFDDPGLAQFCHLPADGFNRQPEKVGNIGAGERQVKGNAVGFVIFRIDMCGDQIEKACHFLGRRLAAQRHHPAGAIA